MRQHAGGDSLTALAHRGGSLAALMKLAPKSNQLIATVGMRLGKLQKCRIKSEPDRAGSRLRLTTPIGFETQNSPMNQLLLVGMPGHLLGVESLHRRMLVIEDRPQVCVCENQLSQRRGKIVE